MLLRPENRDESDPLLGKLDTELDFGRAGRVVGSGFAGDLVGEVWNPPLDGPARTSLKDAGRTYGLEMAWRRGLDAGRCAPKSAVRGDVGRSDMFVQRSGVGSSRV
jgi:hypothetical protein